MQNESLALRPKLVTRPGGGPDARLVVQCNLFDIAIRALAACTSYDDMEGIGIEGWLSRVNLHLTQFDAWRHHFAPIIALSDPSESLHINIINLQHQFFRHAFVLRGYLAIRTLWPEHHRLGLGHSTRELIAQNSQGHGQGTPLKSQNRSSSRVLGSGGPSSFSSSDLDDRTTAAPAPISIRSRPYISNCPFRPCVLHQGAACLPGCAEQAGAEGGYDERACDACVGYAAGGCWGHPESLGRHRHRGRNNNNNNSCSSCSNAAAFRKARCGGPAGPDRGVGRTHGGMANDDEGVVFQWTACGPLVGSRRSSEHCPSVRHGESREGSGRWCWCWREDAA
ncbi:hypothetical protein BS47DRAFT_846940 [Hydnum rufescens UP504]|uniref:Uncharacterized protein n=1 Tax=Hydnum rufescens UP504 TaxID=1448309 RepID=A0A9P6BA91_9AGAM|nr:hypothetical protein BS47DRAFT_846940 [Hydnum rufescens UP504]